MRSLLALILVLFATGCAGIGPPGRAPLDAVFGIEDWTLADTAEHPLLRENVVLETWTRGPWMPPVLVTTLRAGDEQFAVDDADDLRPHVVAIETPGQALLYGELLRWFEPDADAVPGHAILPTDAQRHGLDARSQWATGPAFYDSGDALRWDIEVTPTVDATEAGFVVHRPVALPPGSHPDLDVDGNLTAIVLLEERIGRDGSYAYRVERVLQCDELSHGYVHWAR